MLIYRNFVSIGISSFIIRGLGTVNIKGDFGSFLISFGIAVGWEDILVKNLLLS